MSTSIGMMDPAYFVGRKEILEWLNGYLGLNLQKVEETCTGAVACQLIDSLFPGKVPMSKVNWEARTDADYIQNYKVLQSAFDRLHIEKHIDVQRLIRGKYMDNLEFMQWFKNFHDTTGAADGYDAADRRSRGKGGAKYGGSGTRRPTGPAATRSSRPAAANSHAPTGTYSSSSTKASTKTNPGTTSGAGTGGVSSSSSSRAPASSIARARAAPARPAEPDPQLLAKVEELTQEREELIASVAAVEKERDFYFDKLRDVELLMQNHEQDSGESELTKNAFKILYATDDDQGQHHAEDEAGGLGREVLDGDVAQILAGESDDLLADENGTAGVR
ncbi:unnamed protein product [Ascophyllum nodosum]